MDIDNGRARDMGQYFLTHTLSDSMCLDQSQMGVSGQRQRDKESAASPAGANLGDITHSIACGRIATNLGEYLWLDSIHQPAEDIASCLDQDEED